MARPTFKPTAAQRRQVAIAAGGGMSHEEIAIGMGISRNTLEKHFETELSTGAYAKRLEVLQAMHAAAKRGNMTAAKAYLSVDPKVAVPPVPEGAGEKPSVKRVQAVGKKQQAQVDAATATKGTEWDGLLTPGLPLQ